MITLRRARDTRVFDATAHPTNLNIHPSSASVDVISMPNPARPT
jgi:hypothetical protein